MSQPFGHIPGFHLPGTLIPMGAIAEQQAAMAQADAQRVAAERRRRAALLLLMGQ
jgi:hypothetical protein